MSDSSGPRTFGAPNSGRKRLWVVIGLLFCVLLALASYMLGMPDAGQSAAPPQPVRLPPPAPELPAPAAGPLPIPAPPKTRPEDGADVRLSFRFNYLDNPANWREWRRVSSTQWEEVEPDGTVQRFLLLGRMDDGKMKGTIVRRVVDQKMDVFIPDRTSSRRMYWRNAPEGAWNYMGQVSAEAALPQEGEF